MSRFHQSVSRQDSVFVRPLHDQNAQLHMRRQPDNQTMSKWHVVFDERDYCGRICFRANREVSSSNHHEVCGVDMIRPAVLYEKGSKYRNQLACTWDRSAWSGYLWLLPCIVVTTEERKIDHDHTK